MNANALTSTSVPNRLDEENQKEKENNSVLEKPSPLTMSSRDLGRWGEDVAEAFYLSKGMDILERNWTRSRGEIDLIVQDENETVFVEVKTRKHQFEEFPEEAVSLRKQKIYRMLARCYLAEHPEVTEIRFDAIAISIFDERFARLRHITSAFGFDD